MLHARSAGHFATLIDAPTLANHIDEANWQVVDCRANLLDPAAGAMLYAAGHLPGAFRADLESDLADPPVAGVTGRHPLPDRARLRALFGSWGLSATSQLVAYDADSGMFAARLWWLARWLGHDSVAVLDGGLAAWHGAGLPTTTTSPGFTSTLYPERAPLTRTVSAGQLQRDSTSRVLLDARGADRFAGENETIDPVAGHIAGAISAPFVDNLGVDGTFRSPAELKQRWADAVDGMNQVVCYCGSGITAAHNILALRVAGYPEPSLYPGSWSEWIQDPERPREP